MRAIRPLFFTLLLAAAMSASAQDVLTSGTTSASAGATVTIPVFLQDVDGTPLGVNAGTGKRIQAIAFRLTFNPPGAVTAASFTRVGALYGLTPLYERTVNGTGSMAWIGSFSESSSPIPLTANAPLHGNRIGTLTLTLAGGLANGSSVAMTLDPLTTLLSNQSGTLTETSFSHYLKLTSGSITIGGATTTTTLNDSPNPSNAGQTVTLTAGVTSGTAGTVTGSVAFYDGPQWIGYGLVQSGQAIFTTTALTQGSHSITSNYEGDTVYRPSSSTPVSQVVNIPVTPPANVVATGTSSTTATVTWTAVAGATSYEVRRSVNGGAWTLVGTPPTVSFNDTALTANRAYLYEVRTVSGTASSLDSPLDIATTVMFTDDALVAGTGIKVVHLTELRTAVNALRASAGLAPLTFTDPSAGAGTTIRKVHIDELRAGIAAAYAALGLASPSFTDPTLVAMTTPVKAAHFQQMRDALK